MKNILYCVIVSFTLSGCYSTQHIGKYNLKLTSVDNNGVLTGRINNLVYEDSLMKITWSPDEKEFGFSLLNRYDKNFQILWDKAAIVIDGKSERVFHNGVKYSESEKSQPPTTIVHGTETKDAIVPADNVEYVAGAYSPATMQTIPGHWETKNIYTINSSESLEEAQEKAKENIGKKVIVSLPIKQGEKESEYVFNFEITGVEVKSVEILDPKKSMGAFVTASTVGVLVSVWLSSWSLF